MPHPPSHRAISGQFGEALVTTWVQQQGWQVITRGWHCRWGELDVVAFCPKSICLAFVEIKTRTSGNWDENGLLAITPTKQRKLIYASQLFLAQHGCWAETPCRFDVALVSAKQIPRKNEGLREANWPVIRLGEAIAHQGYSLTLHTYLESAFDGI
jgi:putative endonuclease